MTNSLSDYVNLIESVADYDFDQLSRFISPDIHFVDPFNDTIGLAQYRIILEDMRTQLSELNIEVLESAMAGEQKALLRWRLSGRLNAFGGRPWMVEGCAAIAFDERGLVAEHLDYWDAAGGLYESLPVIGRIMRYLRKRLSAS